MLACIMIVYLSLTVSSPALKTWSYLLLYPCNCTVSDINCRHNIPLLLYMLYLLHHTYLSLQEMTYFHWFHKQQPYEFIKVFNGCSFIVEVYYVAVVVGYQHRKICVVHNRSVAGLCCLWCTRAPGPIKHSVVWHTNTVCSSIYNMFHITV